MHRFFRVAGGSPMSDPQAVARPGLTPLQNLLEDLRLERLASAESLSIGTCAGAGLLALAGYCFALWRWLDGAITSPRPSLCWPCCTSPLSRLAPTACCPRPSAAASSSGKSSTLPASRAASCCCASPTPSSRPPAAGMSPSTAPRRSMKPRAGCPRWSSACAASLLRPYSLA